MTVCPFQPIIIAAIEFVKQEAAAALQPRIYDCHTHTHFSHDSACDPQDTLRAARAKGLAGFAITDHCDIELCQDTDVAAPILQSVACARKLGAQVLAGIELGESIWHSRQAADVVCAADFDLVLGSVHSVRYRDYTMPYSGINFSAFSPKELDAYLGAYFDDLLEMIGTTDFDILAHLTCPLRYLCGKYGITVHLRAHAEQIDTVLKEIIGRNIALEVNTSCLGTGYDALMPDLPILQRYRALGGALITLGSDAHTAQRVAHGFDRALESLSALGFAHIYYYRHRKPIAQKLDDIGGGNSL